MSAIVKDHLTRIMLEAQVRALREAANSLDVTVAKSVLTESPEAIVAAVDSRFRQALRDLADRIEPL